MGRSATLAALLERAGRAGLDAVLPPRCLSCGAVVGGDGALCPPCWTRLAFVGPPHCVCCGLPFPYDAGEELRCGACIRRRPAFDRARAALVYDGASRPLLLGFKHGDETHAAAPFARWMAGAAGSLLTGADLLVPVPLHRWRLFRRRYNQAALLAHALGRGAGRPVATDLLIRRRRTPSQGGLGRVGRAANVRGAFAVPQAVRARIAGRRLLLVDDVMTTGATVEACARALRRAGAAHVDVIVLARVVPEAG
ncbi:MAG: ComF family protein [Inquilinus sp.]|nr:ComF family protein [Inquilinus sp.]